MPSADHTTSADLPAALASTLSGRLPCSRCGYLLDGLSVRDVCPECGLPITTTILAAVDPFAEELQPLARPRLAAAALILWSAAALAAAIWVWGARIGDALAAAGALRPWPHQPGLLLLLVGLSGLGSLVFVYPARRWPRPAAAWALVGAAFYIPLLVALWAIHGAQDLGGPTPYFNSQIDPERHALRLLAGAILCAILLCLRPAARHLVGRSLRLRQGRVDRQTILAMLACIAVAAAGDVAMLFAARSGGLLSDILRVGGLALIGAGSALMTIGLAGMLIDSLRIARAIVSPAPSIRRVLNRPGHGPADVAPNG